MPDKLTITATRKAGPVKVISQLDLQIDPKEKRKDQKVKQLSSN